MKFSTILAALLCLLSSRVLADSFAAVLASVDSLSQIREVLEYHGLVEEIERERNITYYFAPNNDAMAWLADFGLDLIAADPNIARAITRYGIVDGIHTSRSILSGPKSQLLHSHLLPPLFTNVSSGQALKLRGSKHGDVVLETGLQSLTRVVEKDIPFDHGIIHGTERNMVIPHNVSETANIGQLHEFLRLMLVAGVRDEFEALKDATIVVPHDDALAKYRPVLDLMSPAELSGILAHHGVPNQVLYADKMRPSARGLKTLHGSLLKIDKDSHGKILVEDVPVVRQDVIILGGVAHVIDDVLFPSPTNTRPVYQQRIWDSFPLHFHPRLVEWILAASVVPFVAVAVVQAHRRRRARLIPFLGAEIVHGKV